MDPELVAYLDTRFESIDRRFQVIDRRFQAIDRQFEDVRHDIREVHILVEAMDDKVELVAEGVIANTERIGDLRSEMERQFEEVKAVNRLSYAELDRRLREHKH